MVERNQVVIRITNGVVPLDKMAQNPNAVRIYNGSNAPLTPGVPYYYRNITDTNTATMVEVYLKDFNNLEA